MGNAFVVTSVGLLLLYAVISNKFFCLEGCVKCLADFKGSPAGQMGGGVDLTIPQAPSGDLGGSIGGARGSMTGRIGSGIGARGRLGGAIEFPDLF